MAQIKLNSKEVKEVSPLTIDQAKNLKTGDHVYDLINKRKDGTNAVWKVNGKPQTWKTRPECVKVPIKYGLYEFDYITENCLNQFALFIR